MNLIYQMKSQLNITSNIFLPYVAINFGPKLNQFHKSQKHPIFINTPYN